MGVYNNVKTQDISTLKFDELWLAHPNTLGVGVPSPTPAYPCDSTAYANQCAVRLSRSVIESGIDFSDYPEPTCKGEGSFQGSSYARGAESLANYLYVKFGKNKTRRVFIINRNATQGGAAKKQLMHRKGIIFFRNIEGFRNGIGDHIDLWDGQQTTSGEYFNDSVEIWFWEISK